MTAIRPVNPIVVDVVFDLGCPWCFIGTHQLQLALRARPGVAALVRWWPFLLNPDAPRDGLDHATHLLHKYGSRERGARVCRAIEEVGRGVGIAFAFGRVRRVPNTLTAHRLVHVATKLGRAPSAVVEALFHAHFIEGRDIGALDVLVDIGRAAGLDPPALEAYLRGGADSALIATRNAQAHRLGISGVPAFVFAPYESLAS